ncbi:MAG: hypothetical protein QM784_21170 [Polyangiaceae bacterium]
MIVISTGCPAGIGPEISVKSAAEHKTRRGEVGCVLVGDMATLCAAAEVVGVEPSRLVPLRSRARAQARRDPRRRRGAEARAEGLQTG